MSDIFHITGPLLRLIDPETGHRLAIRALAAGLVPAGRKFSDSALATSVWGLNFLNPVGTAAGFDKNAEVVDAALGLGFGFVEIGTVTPRPQPGNPKPRLFRLPADEAVINRMGFNNDGLDAVLRRLSRRRRTGLVGVNIGKNRDAEDALADYVTGVKAAAPLADFLVLNVSSPNTPGLRGLQRRAELAALLEAALAARDEAAKEPGRPPLLVKIAPDLSGDELEDIAATCLETQIDGIIATNTTITRPEDLSGPDAGQDGGLSGRPLFELSTRILGDLYRLTEGCIPLIGVGGVSNGEQAYAKIRAGASLVQLYSAMVYHGPGLANRINRELAALLRRDGFSRIAEAVGADHR